MKRKRVISIGLISILFLLVILFGINQFQENQQYEAYLSHKLVNDISLLSSLTVMNDNHLEEIIEKNQITKEQINYLQNDFENIRVEGGGIVELAEQWLERIENESHYVNPYPVYMASDFRYFLRRLEQEELSEDTTLRLSKEQVEKFKLMKSVNEDWKKAIVDNIEGIYARTINDLKNDKRIATEHYFKTYKDDMINSDDWLDMIKQMRSVSQQYERNIENLF